MNEFLKNLCEKIELPEEFVNAAEPYLKSGEAEKTADRIEKSGCAFCYIEYKKNAEKYAPLLLAASLVSAERVYKKYREKNIPDNIYYGTMTDIAIWAKTLKREENIIGIKNIGWLHNILFFNMFRIGRMQYQFYTARRIMCGVPFAKTHCLTVKFRRPVLNMHIPEGEPLTPEKCRESIEGAKAFFREYFSEYRYDGFVCFSWLLDPNNQLFMNENGNIRKFPELFDAVVRSKYKSFDIVKRLWGKSIKRPYEVADFPESTDLQKRTKKYLLDGGRTGIGYGTIKL